MREVFPPDTKGNTGTAISNPTVEKEINIFR